MIIHGDGSIRLTEEEYDELRKDSLKLNALMSYGVDNWDGYDLAMDEYRESLGEDDEEED